MVRMLPSCTASPGKCDGGRRIHIAPGHAGGLFPTFAPMSRHHYTLLLEWTGNAGTGTDHYRSYK
ncbi:MAG TPA: hypothetical protein PL106_13415, partial [Flavobacteriales bacterium]|nr:hypothetical protein [Flavobacteriales bacterium]